jgi:hypothetical protein
MQYPREFSDKARAAVEAELIRSARRHEDRKRQWASDWPFPSGESVRTCIVEAFLAYALQTIDLGKSGTWTIDKVRLEALEGLRLITIEIGSKTGYEHFIERGGGSITPEGRRTFEATSEWCQFEDGLLALADSKKESGLGAVRLAAVSTTRPFNSLITRGFASDRVADVSLPKLTYEFPPVFSTADLASVTSARLRAEDIFTQVKSSITEFADAESLLLKLILRVFVAFAEVACELGMRRRLTVGELELECLRFLKSYTNAAGLVDSYLLVPLLAEAEIPSGLQKKIEASDEWKQYRRLLQGVAIAQTADTSGPTADKQGKASRWTC